MFSSGTQLSTLPAQYNHPKHLKKFCDSNSIDHGCVQAATVLKVPLVIQLSSQDYEPL